MTNNKLNLVSEQDAAALIMDSYVMRRRIQVCQNCECAELGSTIFEVWIHPTKTARTGFRSERLFSGTQMNRKYAMRVVDMPDRPVPYCSECGDTYTTSESVGREMFPPLSAEQWAETLRRKYTTPEPTTTPKTKTEPSLDML
jgi:hypothetical protein